MSWIFNSGGESNLTGDAASAQKIVNVVDGTKFAADDWIEILDDNAFEINQIDSISTNQLTMVNDLANTYTTAASAKVTKTVTLPISPTKIKCKNATVSKQHPFPDELPLLLSIGKKARVLTFESYIYDPAKTKAQLEKDFIMLLEALTHIVVTLDAPGTRYDSDWLLNDFTYEERGAQVKAFKCKFELWQGSQYLVI